MIAKRGRPRGSGHLQHVIDGRLSALFAGANQCGVHKKMPLLSEHPTQGNIVTCLLCRDTAPFTHNFMVGRDVLAVIQAWNDRQEILSANSTTR